MSVDWTPIINVVATTISLLTLKNILNQNKKKEIKDLKFKIINSCSFLGELNYIKAAMDSIAEGKELSLENGIETSIINIYNIKFPTPFEYSEYFDIEAIESLRAVRTSILEHYSKYWYSNHNNSFSTEIYNGNKSKVSNDAKKCLEIIENGIKIHNQLIEKYDQNLKILNKKWYEELWRFLK